ncbi:uncharacterized protein PAC_05400 [Phialocephala subalpina]|uniref:BTB domain-containing protein n=1 Tax=Phialocephala subalpina TaxID=576137 RepID=A0A1L7WRW1_9HELO|nr:uncharacterized protein PAC_05400 [Phialocephala subalpina]
MSHHHQTFPPNWSPRPSSRFAVCHPTLESESSAQTSMFTQPFLKVNSNYFYKFLNSADKQQLGENTGDFKYIWTTIIDSDGKGWGLEDIRTAEDTTPRLLKVTFDHTQQTAAFHNLLCAVYGKAYELASAQQLILMTELADCYRALPMLSKAVYKALIENDIHFGDRPKVLLEVINKARMQVLTHVVEAQKAVFHLLTVSQWFKKAHSELSFEWTVELPIYYRAVVSLQETRSREWDVSEFRSALKNLLKNNLAFDRQEWCAGESKSPDYFLCAWIKDEDLPWKVDEEDW